MNFYELDSKIKQYNNYKIVAKHIVENKINMEQFLNNLLNEENKAGFFQSTFQNIGSSLDKFKGKLGNMWNKFRGNPTDVNSVLQILEKVREFLSRDPNTQKAYDAEISSLAKTIEGMKTKIGGMAPEAETPAAKDSPEKTPEEDADPSLVEFYLKRLTYGKPIETIESAPNRENYNLYAKELASYPKAEIENTKNKLMKDLKEKISHIEREGVVVGGNKIKPQELEPEVWEHVKKTIYHETWALWDIGKQLYMSKNPSKSGPGYNLGNPLTDEKVQQDSVNRMVGWSLVAPQKLSSLQLIEVGEKAIEGKPLPNLKQH